jgi:hypothetical protein
MREDSAGPWVSRHLLQNYQSAQIRRFSGSRLDPRGGLDNGNEIDDILLSEPFGEGPEGKGRFGAGRVYLVFGE